MSDCSACAGDRRGRDGCGAGDGPRVHASLGRALRYHRRIPVKAGQPADGRPPSRGAVRGLSETGLKTSHAILGACEVTDPEQGYHLTRAWAALGSPPPVPAEHHRGKPAGQDGNRPAPAVPDASGFDLCPDPLAARTAAEFVTALSQFRFWAGEPSFREMERLSDPKVASATMCAALGGDKLVPGSCKLPSQRVVQAIVTACGGTPGHLEAFITARRMIRMKQAPSAQVPQANRAALYPVPDTGNPSRTA